MGSELVLATRGSALALAQAEWVRAELERLHAGLSVRLDVIRTTGDRLQTDPLTELPPKGLFVKEIQEALVASRADLAVHSLKDLPVEPTPGLALAAITGATDPLDALISASGGGLDDLPPGARIGTSSPRRAAQLLHHRPHLQIVPIRGNVDTRLRKLEAGDFDAIVLAAAGLIRLGLAERITERLPLEVCVPAAGQGLLGIETREDDEGTRQIVSALETPEAAARGVAERSALLALGGGCRTPIGLSAVVEGDTLALHGVIADPSGESLRRDVESGLLADAAEVGRRLARRLGSAQRCVPSH
jgi:hydroxymethylbilane synthase